MVNTARSLARSMMQRLPLQGGDLRVSKDWTELVMWREGNQQIELVILNPGVHVPVHRHKRCDSVDMRVAGSGAFHIGERAFNFLRGQPRASRSFDVPKAVWHGGMAGPNGAAWLSFQMWDGEPSFIADDWEAQ